jgi:hypothetical protein
MKLCMSFAAAALFFGALAGPSHATPVAPQASVLAGAQNPDVLDVRWTARHANARHFGRTRGRHYGWTRGRHYGWGHSRHRWR